MRSRIKILEGRLRALSAQKAFFLLFVLGDSAFAVISFCLHSLFKLSGNIEAIRLITPYFHVAYLVFAIVIFLRTNRDKKSNFFCLLYVLTWPATIWFTGMLTPVSLAVSWFIISPVKSLFYG